MRMRIGLCYLSFVAFSRISIGLVLLCRIVLKQKIPSPETNYVALLVIISIFKSNKIQNILNFFSSNFLIIYGTGC